MFSSSTGNGGNLTFDVGHLRINNGGQISTGTFGQENSGDLTINSDRISINFGQIISGTMGGGNAGNLKIDTQELSLINGSLIKRRNKPINFY